MYFKNFSILILKNNFRVAVRFQCLLQIPVHPSAATFEPVDLYSHLQIDRPMKPVFVQIRGIMAVDRSRSRIGLRDTFKFIHIGTPLNPERAKRSEEHTSELQSRGHLVCRLLLEKKKADITSNVPELSD